MSRWRYVLVRLAWTVFAAWLVLSGTFFLFAYTPDPNEVLAEWGAGYAAAQSGGNVTEAQQEAEEAYRSARNQDRPITDRYVGWVVAYGTFDWGVSYTYGLPVRDVILQRGYVTLLYLLPAGILATVVGTLLGLYSGLRERSLPDYLVRSLSYVGLGIPNFWLATVLVLVGVNEFELYTLSRWNQAAPTSAENVPLLAVAGIVVAVHLLAVQLRYARSESRSYRPKAFVKLVRSTGASEYTIARHVFRNAAIPLSSLLFTELLVVAMVDVFVVESVIEVPGLGAAAFEAIKNRDIGLVIGTWMLPTFVVLGGSLLQDLTTSVLDPRIGSDEGE